MDTSGNIDTLDDSSALPELSFDDLLDPSPIKKNNKNNLNDDDDFEQDNDETNRPDDTLNTPGPKKPPAIQKNINTTTMVVTSATKTITTVRTQAVKLGSNPNTLTNVIKNNEAGSSGIGGGTTVPVLLNSKNVLPKTSAPIANNSTIRLTPKVNLAGKTALRTSNGQIIYIHKTPATSNIKTVSSTNVVKSSPLGGNNSKPVTIQVLRTADGNYVPIKTTLTGTSGKNTTLTLSPTSLSGKKIITSAGGHVVIKGTIKSTDITGTTTTAAKTVTTNAIPGLKTVVKPLSSTATTGQISDLNKSKPIIVHGAGGKQIIVSNQSIVKLSPKTQTITTMAGCGTFKTSTSQAVQIPSKSGVQYLRVLPNTKTPAKTLNLSATETTTVAAASTTTTAAASAKNLNTPHQTVKILNSLPQKFTVIPKISATKLMLTQKKDDLISGSNVEFSPMTSKVQKTIVTVPTIKSISDDKNKNPASHQEQSLTKTTQSSLLSGNQTLVRKHKISEINTEIQRMTTTTTTTTADNTGPPAIKRPTPNSRFVVVSSNNTQPKILNNSIQQPGRTTASFSLPARTTNTTKSVGNSGSTVLATQVTQNGNKLYTVLKPPSVEQKTNSKLYSVLKTNSQTVPTAAKVGNKPLISTNQLFHMHQKLLQNKQQQPVAAASLNIKIKEEPTDSNSITSGNTDLTTEQFSLPPLTLPEDENDNLDPMVGGVRRKHCNCSKSQCLKLYCDCFANGEFCQDCTCKDCFNNLENEDERQRAIKTCLERNPNAFKPKITSSRDQGDMRLHNKGCNCKRSGCLKNYCECYEAKIPCSSNCKCVGCRNVEDRPDLDMDPIDPKIMATIAMGGATDNQGLKRSYEKSQRDLGDSLSGVKVKSEKMSKEPVKSLGGYDAMMTGTVSPTLDRQQCNFITQEVIDATIQCMITQADECEKNNLPAYQTEKMVMEELGRCLVEIIDFSIRNTDNSYTQD